MKTLKIQQIRPNPKNPRFIRDDKFARLCKSLNDFPAMLHKRPVVVNEDGIILGGNMRFRAAKDLGWKEIPVEIFSRKDAEKEMAERGKTYEELCDEFVIKDNSSFGEWDWDALANEWNVEALKEWGLDVPQYDSSVDIDGFFEEKPETEKKIEFRIILQFTEEEYGKVMEAFKQHEGTKESVVYKLLGL